MASYRVHVTGYRVHAGCTCGRPVASYRVHANAHTSAWTSKGVPERCSGDMYSGVPTALSYGFEAAGFDFLALALAAGLPLALGDANLGPPPLVALLRWLLRAEALGDANLGLEPVPADEPVPWTRLARGSRGADGARPLPLAAPLVTERGMRLIRGPAGISL